MSNKKGQGIQQFNQNQKLSQVLQEMMTGKAPVILNHIDTMWIRLDMEDLAVTPEEKEINLNIFANELMLGRHDPMMAGSC